MRLKRLVVTSRSNLELVKGMQFFEGSKFMLVTGKLTRKPKTFNGEVWAIGGGSVIDTAKLLAGKKPCYVIPTTASGAAMTTHAVIWKKHQKVDIQTPLPVLSGLLKDHPFNLSRTTLQRTMIDCLCHILESRYSKNRTRQSMSYANEAEHKFMRYVRYGKIEDLITAGNWAGRAIEITGTNFIHAISYVLSLGFDMEHGDALKEAFFVRRIYDHEKLLEAASRYPKFKETVV